MGAKSFTIKGAATSMTVVGGADVSYTETGKVVPSGVEVSVAAVADFRIRPFAEFKNRQPIYDPATGTYSKAKLELKMVYPRISAVTGKMYFDVDRHIFEISPETSAADRLDMRLRSGQCTGLSTLATFWDTGSLS